MASLFIEYPKFYAYEKLNLESLSDWSLLLNSNAQISICRSIFFHILTEVKVLSISHYKYS